MVLLYFIILVGILVIVFLQHPKFGRIPKGKRLEEIQRSSHFRNGIFQNLSETPQLAEDARFSKMFHDMFFSKNRKPREIIPSVRTDIKELSLNRDVLIWFGHSSYYIQIEGKRILVDPVLYDSASPFPFMIKAFKGTNLYRPEDIPEIDYLFITHDHWDHLDYKTVKKLKSKIKTVICSLGVGEHFEYWGFDKNRIIEKDWNQKIQLDNDFVVHVTPARHFSGRGMKAKRTLWSSFVFLTPTYKFFLGGDGGYDIHFAEIGRSYGEFDLVILENGQYNKNWKYIHMMPEQVLQAAIDLKAKKLLPVHSSKFALSVHPWNEPLKLITELNRNKNVTLITPVIGEIVNLKDNNQKFSNWWEGVS